MTQQNTRNCSMQLGGIEIKLASWQTDSKNVAASILITTGPVLIAETLDVEKSQILIDMLNIHIDNIKKIEIDLIALQSKAAA